MRTSILFWSAASGFIVGLLIGGLLFGAVVVGSELLSPAVPRLEGRPRLIVAIVALVILPAAGAVLGLLEGRLKLR